MVTSHFRRFLLCICLFTSPKQVYFKISVFVTLNLKYVKSTQCFIIRKTKKSRNFFRFVVRIEYPSYFGPSPGLNRVLVINRLRITSYLQTKHSQTISSDSFSCTRLNIRLLYTWGRSVLEIFGPVPRQYNRKRGENVVGTISRTWVSLLRILFRCRLDVTYTLDQLFICT